MKGTFFFPMWFQPSSTTYPFAEIYRLRAKFTDFIKNLPDNFLYMLKSLLIFSIYLTMHGLKEILQEIKNFIKTLVKFQRLN